MLYDKLGCVYKSFLFYARSEIPSRTVLSENALPDDNDNYDPDEPSFDKNLTLHSKENEKIKTKKKKRKKPKPGS